jgi:hypothetical protein
MRGDTQGKRRVYTITPQFLSSNEQRIDYGESATTGLLPLDFLSEIA